MRFVKIEDGVVKNAAIYDTDPGIPWIVSEKANIGDSYINGEFLSVKKSGVDEIKQALTSDFNSAMAAVHQGWPDYEIQTWTVQNAEARAWIKAPVDNRPETPLLTGMHHTREAMGWSEPFEDFVGRIIHNSNQYTTAVAALLAMRHVFEREIEESEDPMTVQWSFNLQEPDAESRYGSYTSATSC